MLSYACISLQAACWHRSGLRGAVGLALSLFVFLDDSIADRRFRVLTFFYMGAMAFLTLIIQGTTTPFLLRVRAWAGHAHTAPHLRSHQTAKQVVSPCKTLQQMFTGVGLALHTCMRMSMADEWPSMEVGSWKCASWTLKPGVHAVARHDQTPGREAQLPAPDPEDGGGARRASPAQR